MAAVEDSSDTTIDESQLDVPKRARTGRAFLTLMSGEGAGETHVIELEEVTIGRDPEASVTLTGSDISRRHAKIICDRDHTAKVLDLESRNGTFVNGTPVVVEVLRDGDRLRVGKHIVFAFRYEYERVDAPKAVERDDRDTMVDGDDDGASHHERALAHYERTLEMREQRLGRRHPSIAEVLNRIGEVLRSIGDLDGAIARHERALSIYEAENATEAREVAETLLYVGECHLARDSHTLAIDVLTRAVKIGESTGATPTQLAWPKFALARALRATGQDDPLSASLAKQARAGFEAGSPDARVMVARVDEAFPQT